MKFIKNKLFAFTLAELMVIFFIIGVVVASTASIYTSQIDVAKKYQYYAALSNTIQDISEILAAQYDTDPAGPPTPPAFVKYLPIKGNYVNAAQPDGLNNGLCQRFSELINTIGAIDCTLTKSSGTFALTDANFVATNGMRFFNFGTDPVLTSGPHVDTNDYFTVYIDIDGPNGSGTLDKDVMGFKIYRGGLVLPTRDSAGGNSTKYMKATVRYGTSPSYTLLDTGVPYLEAACHAGKLTGATDCPAVWNSISGPCSPAPSTCEVVINKP